MNSNTSKYIKIHQSYNKTCTYPQKYCLSLDQMHKEDEITLLSPAYILKPDADTTLDYTNFVTETTCHNKIAHIRTYLKRLSPCQHKVLYCIRRNSQNRNTFKRNRATNQKKYFLVASNTRSSSIIIWTIKIRRAYLKDYYRKRNYPKICTEQRISLLYCR